ncbi:MAG: hypothetical protein JOZ10_18720 [Acidobacteria bacterium]|nr:hypothetical protein [Acidobacteriota bacterium]MBV9144813.1 hypothetical protein [Acidobacteriota bacterium]
MSLTGWGYFWAIWLLIAGASFAFITAIVTVLGLRDLRILFKMLRDQEKSE